MKCYLFLLVLSPVVVAQLSADCATHFLTTVAPLLLLDQDGVRTLCTDPMQQMQKLLDLRKLTVTCGLGNLGGDRNALMLQGLLKFAGDLLCSKKYDGGDVPNGEPEYCFPHAIKLINLQEFISAATTSEWSKVDIMCNVFGDEKQVKLICPHGPEGSAKKLCQKEMVKMFDQALLQIRRLLKMGPLAEFVEGYQGAILPLLRLAKDIRSICRNSTNSEEIKSFVEYKCQPDKPVPEWCQMNPDHIDGSRDRVKPAFMNFLNVAESYGLKTLLKDDQEIDTAKAKNMCCPQACRKWRKEQTYTLYTTETVIRTNGFDLWSELEAKPDFRKDAEKRVCSDRAATGSFNPANCKCVFKRKSINRRLLEDDIVAEITVNQSTAVDSSAPTCEDSGSMYGLDSLINANMNSTSNTSVQVDQVDCTLLTPPKSTDENSGMKLFSSSLVIIWTLGVYISL